MIENITYIIYKYYHNWYKNINHVQRCWP